MLLQSLFRSVFVRYIGYYQCDCGVSCVLTGLDPALMWASSLLASQRWMVEVHLSHSASCLRKTCKSPAGNNKSYLHTTPTSCANHRGVL